MLPGIVFLLLCCWHRLRTLTKIVSTSLLVNPYSTVPRKNVFLFLAAIIIRYTCFSLHSRLNIVERWCEVDINISLDDADGVVLVFGTNFEDVDFKFFAENFDDDGVFFVQTGKVSQLILENCFGIVKFDEFGLMRLEFDHVPDVTILLLEIRNQCNCSLSSWLREFQHFEHPVGDIAEALLRYEFQHSAVSHLGTVFYAEDEWIFVFGVEEREQFVECRRR
jgi:hypothetical protein